MTLKQIDLIARLVTCQGIAPIMFDRYSGSNKEVLSPEQKLYLNSEQEICLPAINIISFLCAENTKSAVKLLYDSRDYKKIAQALLGYVSISPELIPLKRNGEPIVFHGFDETVKVVHSIARLKGGIPNPKERPAVMTPWEITFSLQMIPNEWFSEEALRNLFERGGIMIGFGTFRGVYGKFKVKSWE